MLAGTRTKDRRKAIPVGVKLQCALTALAEALGLDSDTRFEFDHTPALGLRDWDEEAGDYQPPQNDPHFIICRPEAEHDRKTFGTKATTYGSDIHVIAKDKRLTREQEDFRRRLLAKEPGKPRERTGTFGSRPFNSKGKCKFGRARP